jgi:hypothetical protein
MNWGLAYPIGDSLGAKRQSRTSGIRQARSSRFGTRISQAAHYIRSGLMED